MLSSKEVFTLRKEGKKEEAYNLAVELMQSNPNDDWNVKAFAYCLMDMIKISSAKNDRILTQKYLSQLNELKIDSSDEILTKNVARANQLADPNQKIIFEARNLSKQGNHNQAINLYRQALIQFPGNAELHESLGWELYRVGKNIFSAETINVSLAKQLLNEYIKLKNTRPSLLHSLFLRYADKLTSHENFNLVAFLTYWNLDNLTPNDFKPYEAENGNIYKSIAEKIIQHAAKDALNRRKPQDIKYMIPYVEQAIDRFPDNFWLIYYKVKLLHEINENEKALEFSLLVVKNKIDQYWAWDLLGDVLLNIDSEKTFSCYCKALQCRAEDKFLANVRIKLAKLLIDKSMFNEAKYEISQAIKSREKEGWKLTEILLNHQSSEWYINAVSAYSNKELYKSSMAAANNLLFDMLPWLKATVGDTFIIPSKPNKPKRKLFVLLQKEVQPIEISIPENKFNFKSLSVGESIKVKGEYNQERRFQVYLLEGRKASSKWDIFPQHLAMIDHINFEKKIVHFIVDKNFDSIMRFADFPIEFKIADTLLIRVSAYKNSRGIRYTALTCERTEQELEQAVAKRFSSRVARVSSGLGFTDDDIFIDRGLINQYSINEDDYVNGVAVINYNKKKSTWGWKAITISKL